MEPKTLHPDHLRVVAARRKIQAIKRLVGVWREGTWRDVAAYLGNEHKAAACCRLVKDADFHPSIALIETIEALSLPIVSDNVPLEERRKSAGSKPRARRRYFAALPESPSAVRRPTAALLAAAEAELEATDGRYNAPLLCDLDADARTCWPDFFVVEPGDGDGDGAAAGKGKGQPG